MKTVDVCELDFPPVSYGETLTEAEATIQKILETIFRDESGLMRSGVNGKTMKPYRPEDVKEREFGIGGWAENSSFPREYKNIWLNFEDCHQATGKYLGGLVDKYSVTEDSDILGYAKQTISATISVWEIAAKTHRYGKGWLPKPYAGMHEIDKMDETSVDQYAGITFGLEKYYNELATPDEKAVLTEMFLSFADWWIDHNYTTSYIGMTVWWDRVHMLAQAYFLYLFQLAYSLAPRKKYLKAFDYIFSLAEGALVDKEGPYDGDNFNPNCLGVVIEAMSRIARINPQLKVFCKNCIRNSIPALIEAGIAGKAGRLGPVYNMKPRTAKYLASAYEFSRDEDLLKQILEFLSSTGKRTDFYWIKRGLDLEDSALVNGKADKDDYRDVFNSNEHGAWLAAYWRLRRINIITTEQ